MTTVENNTHEDLVVDSQKTNVEVKKLKKLTGVIGLIMVIIVLLPKVIAPIYSNFMVTYVLPLNLGTKLGLDFLNDPIFWNELIGIIIIIAIHIVPLIFVFKTFKYSFKDMFGNPNMKPLKIVQTVLIAEGMALLVVTPISSFISNTISSLGTTPEITHIATQPKETVMAQIMAVIAAVIVAPIIEEIFYRGFILRSLMPYGKWFSIVTSALIFGLIHGNFEQMPNAILIGLLFGYIAVKTNSIIVTIMIHVLHNGLIQLGGYAAKYHIEFASTLRTVISIVAMIFFIIKLISVIHSFIKTKKEKTHKTKNHSDNKALVVQKPYAVFFTSPTIIIFLITITYFLIKTIKIG